MNESADAGTVSAARARAEDPESQLRSAIALLAGSGPEHSRVAHALKLWLDSEDHVALEAALNVGVTWRSNLRVRRRDEILNRVARRYFADRSARRGARALADAIESYETGEFKTHRRTGVRPGGLRGELFDLLSCGAPMLGEQALRLWTFSALRNVQRPCDADPRQRRS